MRATPLLAFVLSVALVAGAAAPPGGAAVRWGEHGHRMVGQAAAVALPPAMPEFFRKAAPQLSYLNPEPDRWRDRRERDIDPAMDGAHAPEHYVDMELVVRNGLSAPHRLAYAESLLTGGAKASTVGLLPYTTLELFQRLRVGFREWRAAPNAQLREWIEQRIINDAGILGHYVADGSNPHHTSQHHDRWVGDNPHGFTTERGFHGRFESAFVQGQVKIADVQPLVVGEPRVLTPAREAVWGYLQTTFGHLERLYELDKQRAFAVDNTSPEHKRFAAERLAAGATMLRDLWWTAWITSAEIEKR